MGQTVSRLVPPSPAALFAWSPSPNAVRQEGDAVVDWGVVDEEAGAAESDSEDAPLIDAYGRRDEEAAREHVHATLWTRVSQSPWVRPWQFISWGRTPAAAAPPPPPPPYVYDVMLQAAKRFPTHIDICIFVGECARPGCFNCVRTNKLNLAGQETAIIQGKLHRHLYGGQTRERDTPIADTCPRSVVFARDRGAIRRFLDRLPGLVVILPALQVHDARNAKKWANSIAVLCRHPPIERGVAYEARRYDLLLVNQLTLAVDACMRNVSVQQL